jgi:hypothetical protein
VAMTDREDMVRPVLCLVAVVFGGCASAPDQDGRPLTDAESRTTAAANSTGVEVCELVGRDSIVKVMASAGGTRYTLCSLDGAILARDLDAVGLARLRPDLDPESMQADWGRGPLMLMDRAE